MPDTQRKLAQTMSVLLMPAALAAYALAGWRIAADMRWAGEFAITQGIFSHWQVWTVVGATIHFTGIGLGRLGRSATLGDRDATAN